VDRPLRFATSLNQVGTGLHPLAANMHGVQGKKGELRLAFFTVALGCRGSSLPRFFCRYRIGTIQPKIICHSAVRSKLPPLWRTMPKEKPRGEHRSSDQEASSRQRTVQGGIERRTGLPALLPLARRKRHTFPASKRSPKIAEAMACPCGFFPGTETAARWRNAKSAGRALAGRNRLLAGEQEYSTPFRRGQSWCWP